MMKPAIKFFLPQLFALAFLLGVPLLGLAATAVPSQLVPKCNVWNNATHHLDNPCGWPQVVELANNILQYMLYIAVPIAAIAFAYAGWLYLSARGNTGQISKAHGVFGNVAIGLVIVLVAWLVVNELLKSLAVNGSFISVF